MKPVVQKRTLKTRARLVAAAEGCVAENGYEALRIEEVVARAGVAKGTFFAHFRDKEELMALLIAKRAEVLLSDLAQVDPPRDIEALVAAEAPLIDFLTSERYVFDIFLRHSGALTVEEAGPIATCIFTHGQIVAGWLDGMEVRRDVPSALLADGVEAFLMQAMALTFCALHQQMPVGERLTIYLRAWLISAA